MATVAIGLSISTTDWSPVECADVIANVGWGGLCNLISSIYVSILILSDYIRPYMFMIIT